MNLLESLPHAVGYNPDNHLVFMLCSTTAHAHHISMEGIGAVPLDDIKTLPLGGIATQLGNMAASAEERNIDTIILLATGSEVYDNSLILEEIATHVPLDVFFCAVVTGDKVVPVYSNMADQLNIVEDMAAQTATEAILAGHGSAGSREDIEATFRRDPKDPMTLEQWNLLNIYTKATPETVPLLGRWFHTVLTEPLDPQYSDRLVILHAAADIPTRDWMLMLLTQEEGDASCKQTAFAQMYTTLLDAYRHAPSWATDDQLAHLLGLIALAAWQAGIAAGGTIAVTTGSALDHHCTLMDLMERVIRAGAPTELWTRTMGSISEQQIIAAMGGTEGPAL